MAGAATARSGAAATRSLVRRRRSGSARGSAATWTATRTRGRTRSSTRSSERGRSHATSCGETCGRSAPRGACRPSSSGRCRSWASPESDEPYAKRARAGSGSGWPTTSTPTRRISLGDLARIDATLRAHGAARVADGALADLRARVEVFGLHVATLDVRVHASEVRERAERVVAAFAAAATARERHGPRSIDRVIVSMTASAGDVLAAEKLAREAGLDVQRCRCSRRSPTYAAHATSRPSSSTRARGHDST